MTGPEDGRGSIIGGIIGDIRKLSWCVYAGSTWIGAYSTAGTAQSPVAIPVISSATV